MIRIAVDGMGGDYAPQEIVAGACQAANDFAYEIVLVGRDDAIKRELNRHKVLGGKLSVRHASEVVTMADSPVAAIKSKKDSSIGVCLDLLKNKEVDAVVSAGNTGAVVAAATLKVGLLKGVRRAGIAISMPTLQGLSLIMDVGANIDPKPEHLYQYAIMCDIFARYIHKKKRPAVSLLNIGEEETKGTEVLQETYKMLRDSKLNFIGNIEGRDLFSGRSDCIICDGFVGNVLLKVFESFSDTLSEIMERKVKHNILSLIGAFFLKPALDELQRESDYSEAGGAPLLGINGIVIIGHGGSNAKAIRNGIRVAGSAVESDINGQIMRELEQLQAPGNEPAQ